MSRSSILGLIAALAVVVGVPVAVVALGGGGDAGGGDDLGAVEAGEPIREDDVPPEEAGDGQSPQDEQPGRGRDRRGGGGGRPAEPSRADYPASGNVAHPNDVTPAGRAVAAIVEARLGAIAPKAGQLTIIGADCRRGSCSARYVSGPHGGGRILADAVAILRRVLARRGVRRVTLYVHEPHGKRSRAVEAMALMVVGCDRRDHPGFAWSALNARNVDSRCRITERSPGRLGAQIRKGRLSERDASRGRDAGSGGQGGATEGPDAPPGAKPPGTPAPRTVNRKRDGGGR
jgi:hypothetical protein